MTPRHHQTLIVIAIGLGIACVGGYGWRLYGNRVSESKQIFTATATKGPIDHIISEQGKLESSRSVDIVCEVKSNRQRTNKNGATKSEGVAILWVIPEGSFVKKGDPLIQLDSSGIEESLKRQRIVVTNAEAALIHSETSVRTAQISLPQYIQGLYLSERKTILSQVARAQQNLRKAELSMASVLRLAEKGAIAKLQVESAEFEVVNATNALESERSKLRVLEQLTKQKNLIRLESDIDAAEAQLRASGSVLREHQARLMDLEAQIARCSILAPDDGVVIYNNLDGRKAGQEFIVEEGALVRERQAILKLPDPRYMRVKANVNETSIMSIHEGMVARVTVDAVPGEMMGRFTRVSRHTKREKGGSTVKDYATYVEIIDPLETIQVGMTAEVQIFVEHLPDALQIPIQCVMEHERRMYCLRQCGDDAWETVEIEIGASDDTMVVIKQGLNEDDVVVIAPDDHRELLEFPEVDDSFEREQLKKIAAAENSMVDRSVEERRKPGSGKSGPRSQGSARGGKKKRDSTEEPND